MKNDPVPLATTYLQLEPQFSYENIVNSVIDEDLWEDSDPVRLQTRPDIFVALVGLNNQMILRPIGVNASPISTETKGLPVLYRYFGQRMGEAMALLPAV